MSNQFQKLLDLFNAQALRPFLASTKEKLDQTLDALPPGALARQLEDAFEQLKNPAANLGDQLGGQLDAAKIEPVIDALKARLQNPTVSLIVAHGLKQLAKRNSAQSLQDGLSSALSGLGPKEQLIAQVVLSQLSLALDNLKGADANDVAKQLRSLAGALPSDLVAQQIAELLKSVPQALPKQSVDLSQVPSPDALAGTVTDILKAASDALYNASKGTSFNDTLDALKQFPANANEIIERLKGGQGGQGGLGKKPQAPDAQDKNDNKPPRKRKPRGGGKFDF